jgi:CIC family chloride channel protein
MFRVAKVMRAPDDARAADADQCWSLIEQGVYLDVTATLEQAMPLFERANVPFVPVVTLSGGDQPPELSGALFHVDALKAYNRALAAVSEEEHS